MVAFLNIVRPRFQGPAAVPVDGGNMILLDSFTALQFGEVEVLVVFIQ